MPKRILKHLGVKRLALIALGTLGLVRGFSYVNPPDVPSGLTTLDALIPIEYWGWAWAAVGAIALIAAFTPKYRTALIPIMILSALWSFSYITEWATMFFSRGVDTRDYITAASYGAQALLILAVIRLIDPSEVKTREGNEDDN